MEGSISGQRAEEATNRMENKRNLLYCRAGGPPFGFGLSLGIKYGVRFGFNVGELFDFLFGIAGIDFKEDDIGWQED